MPQPGAVVIREMRPSDEAPAVDLLTAAFLDFPTLQVMAGSDAGARGRMTRMFAMEFEPESAMSALVADLDGRIVGVLTYTDSPACSALSAGRMVRFMRVAGPRVFRTMRMFGRIERAHPRTPHRHLPSLGVHPELQNQGIGRRLMEEFDRRCDHHRMEAYLETVRWADPARPSHERFYGRLGYVLADLIPMTDDWSVVTMIRPRGGAPAD